MVTTSYARSRLALKSFMMLGKATFTTVVSSITMKLPTTTTTRTPYLYGMRDSFNYLKKAISSRFTSSGASHWRKWP